MAEFLPELHQQDGIGARALEFIILTASRTSEVIKAEWREFNLVERVWVVPAEHMKAGREHRVPLSGRAIEILAEMGSIRLNKYVFPGARGGPMNDATLRVHLRRMGRGNLTVHGFRSTFSDWCSEQTNFPAEVREMALAHAVGDKVEAAYRRGDLFQKRRHLMDAWASFATAEPRGNVVPLVAAR